MNAPMEGGDHIISDILDAFVVGNGLVVEDIAPDHPGDRDRLENKLVDKIYRLLGVKPVIKVINGKRTICPGKLSSG